MSKEIVARVTGDHYTYLVKKDAGTFSTTFYVVRDDGKLITSTSSKASAMRKAYEKAGPNAFES